MEKKQEQGVTENGKHIPNRIFRGRIVEFARKNQGQEMFIDDLGKSIKKDYQSAEEEWLLKLLEKLQGDRLLKYKIMNSRVMVSLPH